MKRESLQIGALMLWLLFAIIFCIGAILLKIGTPAHPGPGFMPFLIGIFMGGLSLLALIKALRTRSKANQGKSPSAIFPAKKIVTPVTMFVSVFVYALILPSLGYLVSTSALMLVLFKGVASQRWGSAIIATILAVLLSYYIFVIWLGCQVPVLPNFLRNL